MAGPSARHRPPPLARVDPSAPRALKGMAMTGAMRENEDGPGATDEAVQLGTEETLEGPLGTDPLDAGYIPNDRPVAIDDFGTTAAEAAEGEPLEDKLARERPDVPAADEQRSGRLVAADEGVREDDQAQLVATDVGIDGGAASAEEAAVHDQDGPRYAGDGTDGGLSDAGGRPDSDDRVERGVPADGDGLAAEVEAVTAAIEADSEAGSDGDPDRDAAATDAAADAAAEPPTRG